MVRYHLEDSGYELVLHHQTESADPWNDDYVQMLLDLIDAPGEPCAESDLLAVDHGSTEAGWE